MLSVSKFMTLLPLTAVDLPQSAAILFPRSLSELHHHIPGALGNRAPTCCVGRDSGVSPGTARFGGMRARVSRRVAVVHRLCHRAPTPLADPCGPGRRSPRRRVDRPGRRLGPVGRTASRDERGGRGMLGSSSLPARRRVGVRPDSSVVEHLHGKEKVKSSILFRGSDRPAAHPAVARPRGGVAQVVRAHGS